MRAEWTVSREQGGMKLVDFLKECLGDKASSLKQVKRWVDKGLCTVNGACQRFGGRTVSFRDHVILVLPEERQAQMSFDPSQVLYEDEMLFVYNKPAGVTCDPKGVRAFFGEKPLFLAHRLDKDTTGVLLFGKSEEAKERLMAQFKDGKVQKEYLAIVEHPMVHKKGTVQKHLGPERHYQGQTVWGVVAKDGQYARTDWQVEKKSKTATLVRLFPKTGRTHQIRVHMSYIGHPLVGDRQYGGHEGRVYESWSYFLHSEKLSFLHPTTGRRMSIEAPLPKAFKDAADTIFGCDA